MNPWLNHMQNMTRRQLFQQAGMGMGGAALGSLLAEDLGAAVENGGLHFAPKAKRVIYIHLVGAPSHLDLFDHKPMLQKHHGELCPDEFFVGQQRRGQFDLRSERPIRSRASSRAPEKPSLQTSATRVGP